MNINNGSENKVDLDSEKRDIEWSSLAVDVYVKTAIIGALLYWFFKSDISSIVNKWINDPSWSHGFLIPLFSLYFINQHKNEILSLKSKPSFIGFILLVPICVFYLANIVYFQIGYFSKLAPIAALGAVVLLLGGWKLVKYTWLPVCYLFFAVPLPDALYRMITVPMRVLAAQIANALLNIVPDLSSSVNGVVIDVIYKGVKLEPALNVAEACSGMRLLMAFLALGVAMAYLHPRAVWQRLVLLASTVPIAILCNVVRVTVTGFIFILWDPKYATGIYHDLLGMLMLPLAFGLYGGLAWFTSNLLVEDKDEQPKEDIIVRKKNSDE
jgi:exosortase